MTTAPEDPGMMTNQEANVLVAITELRTQVSSFIDMMKVQGGSITTLTAETASLNNRVTILEAQRKAAPTATSVLGLVVALISILGFVIYVLDRFYGN